MTSAADFETQIRERIFAFPTPHFLGVAALNLVLDFDFIERGVQYGAVKRQLYGAGQRNLGRRCANIDG